MIASHDNTSDVAVSGVVANYIKPHLSNSENAGVIAQEMRQGGRARG
jgi:hypothetical protein